MGDGGGIVAHRHAVAAARPSARITGAMSALWAMPRLWRTSAARVSSRSCRAPCFGAQAGDAVGHGRVMRQVGLHQHGRCHADRSCQPLPLHAAEQQFVARLHMGEKRVQPMHAPLTASRISAGPMVPTLR
jgi:hypothetical protein